jgi:hypothetical protein
LRLNLVLTLKVNIKSGGTSKPKPPLSTGDTKFFQVICG